MGTELATHTRVHCRVGVRHRPVQAERIEAYVAGEVRAGKNGVEIACALRPATDRGLRRRLRTGKRCTMKSQAAIGLQETRSYSMNRQRQRIGHLLQSYLLIELFRCLGTTERRLFSNRFTVQYPNVKIPKSPCFKRLHPLRRYPNG